MFCLNFIYSQTSYSCSRRIICFLNTSIKKYDIDTSYDESSLFFLNKMETMITHTTELQKSTYYIQSKTYNERRALFDFNVISDSGYNYTFMLSEDNKTLSILLFRDGKSILLIFIIKAVF